MILAIYETAFKDCKFNIDPSTLNFYGSTNDYNYNDRESKNVISFRLEDHEATKEVVEKVKLTFRYNGNVDDYIKITDKFEDYESDKRPRITIIAENGMRGLKNPLSFSLYNPK
jgi:hypothetical protein